MILIPCHDPAFDSVTLPESIYDKVECVKLRYAFHPSVLNSYVELTESEYMEIADKIEFGLIQIPVAHYLDARYYASMPAPMFEVLNAAMLNGQEHALVDKSQFDEMMRDFNNRGSFIRHAQ